MPLRFPDQTSLFIRLRGLCQRQKNAPNSNISVTFLTKELATVANKTFTLIFEVCVLIIRSFLNYILLFFKKSFF